MAVPPPGKDPFRMANPRAIKRAEETPLDLLKDASEATRTVVRAVIVRMVTEGWAYRDGIKALVQEAGLPEDLAEMVNGYENRRAQNLGRIDSWRASWKITGHRTMKKVSPRQGGALNPICQAVIDAGAIDIDDSWPQGFSPPFYPGCRCILIPAVGGSTHK